MRDALSLLDQAIAFGGGKVAEAEVREMLGVVDSRYARSVLEALVSGDASALVGLAEQITQANLAVDVLLQDVAALLQRIAVAQAGVTLADNDGAIAAQFATTIASEDIQVYYQIALHGARDASLAVDPLSGLTMALLRMFAFRPAVLSLINKYRCQDGNQQHHPDHGTRL